MVSICKSFSTFKSFFYNFLTTNHVLPEEKFLWANDQKKKNKKKTHCLPTKKKKRKLLNCIKRVYILTLL